ncbi:MAG: hypothetical protein U0802_13345 [Candidatus Binatia bacterium]
MQAAARKYITWPPGYSLRRVMPALRWSSRASWCRSGVATSPAAGAARACSAGIDEAPRSRGSGSDGTPS